MRDRVLYTRLPPIPSPLAITLALMLALSPLEGYLQDVSGSAGKVAPGLFLVTWAGDRLWRRRRIGVAHPVVSAVAALLAVVLISTALHAYSSYALFGAGRWVPFLVLTVALVDVLATDVHPRVALTALVTGALVAGFGSLYSFVVLNDPRASGPLSDPNDLAYILVAAVPVVATRLGVARGPAAALAGGAALSLLLAGTAVTVSRGGAIAIGVTLAWVVLRQVVPGRLLVAGLAVTLVLGSSVALIATGQVRNALDQKGYIATTNVDTRLLRWQSALRLMAANPWFGAGPSGAAVNYVQYSDDAELAERTPVTHNMYFEVGAELGVPGEAAFLTTIGLALAASQISIRRRRRLKVGRDDPLLLAALGVQGSLLAVLTASMFLSEEYYMPLWAGIAVAAAVELRSRPPARGVAS
jgi:O-antigen ligase